MNVVDSPISVSYNNYLQAVSVLSSNDAWAVGKYHDGSIFHTLATHWNGTAWSVTPSPNLGTGEIDLAGVSTVSSNNAWAVGYYVDNNGNHRLVEHWNGTAWSIVASPNVLGELVGVSAVSSNDVWAVGAYLSGSVGQTLVEHWKGTAWSIMTSPNAGNNGNSLTAVSARASNDVWAVGTYFDYAINTLVEHWAGSAWSIVASPNPGNHENVLNGVSTVSSTDAWAVGYLMDGFGFTQTLAEHWNGTAWSVVPSPNPGGSTYGDALFGVSALASGDVWAVGVGGPIEPLVEKYGGACGGATPSPTSPSGSSPTPSSTHLPTQTPGGPTATPEACTIQFTDVAQGSTFYQFVHCLACRSIVGGYTASPPCTTGTPCFLPGNNVTRGQTAKFVSMAAGYQDAIPVNQQTVTDVIPNSTFWQFVERVHLHEVVAGYTSSPPCTTGIPCFLPGNTVTRGQTAKFISNAFFPNCLTPVEP